MSLGQDDNPFFKIFTRLIFQAWEARETALRQLGKSLVPPRIVSDFKQKLAQMTQEEQRINTEQRIDTAGMNFDDLLGSMSMDFHGQGTFFWLGRSRLYRLGDGRIQ